MVNRRGIQSLRPGESTRPVEATKSGKSQWRKNIFCSTTQIENEQRISLLQVIEKGQSNALFQLVASEILRQRFSFKIVRHGEIFVSHSHQKVGHSTKAFLLSMQVIAKKLVWTTYAVNSFPERTSQFCVKWKPIKVHDCRVCKVVIYCILITTRNAKSHSVTSKTRNTYLE